MAWVDLIGRAGLPTVGDLNAYPRQQTRIVCWPQAQGTNDLVAYQMDLRPFVDAPAGPILVDMAATLTDESVFTGTLSGHTGGGGGGSLLMLLARRRYDTRRRRH